jgi:L-amino acid N-acyltransferase
VIIRPAVNDDAVPIASILNALVATTTIEWTETPQTPDSILEWLAEHERVLVAEDEGAVVGVAAFGWFRDVAKRPGYRFAVENTVHVRADHWRSGVGRALMDVLVDEARATGKHTMVAAIDGANEASIRFHERLGFVRVARIPEAGAKFGRCWTWCCSSCVSTTGQHRTTADVRLVADFEQASVGDPAFDFRYSSWIADVEDCFERLLRR